MIETIKRYTCDCCGAKFDRSEGDKEPLTMLAIPVRYYDKMEGRNKNRIARMTVCSDCVEVVAKAILEKINIYYRSDEELICELRACFYCRHRSITHSCSDGQCRVVVFCKLTGDETSNGATCPEWEERNEKC